MNNAGYNVHRFQQDFTKAFTDIVSRSKQAILCGGTGMYIQAVLDRYQMTSVSDNPQLRKQLSGYSKEDLISKVATYLFPKEFKPDTSSKKRLVRATEIGEFLKSNPKQDTKMPNFEPIIFGLVLERNLRRQWITKRLKQQLKNGLIEEVEALIRHGISKDQLRFYGLEYKFVTDHLDGLIDRDELFVNLNVAIHQFAKKQMTWFRKMEREGNQINWIDAQLPLKEKVKVIVDKCCG